MKKSVSALLMFLHRGATLTARNVRLMDYNVYPFPTLFDKYD